MRSSKINKLRKILLQIYLFISSESIPKRLGYSKRTKLLIIHADDLGLSNSENTASIEAMEKGMVNSGSIMVPCPKFQEMANYSKTHPEADMGIHLTLTCEWNSYKWKPILPQNEIASIVDYNGFFFESVEKLVKNFIPNEIEKEFRAQINQAIEYGIDLTHIDSHMLIAFSNYEIQKIFIALGKEFKLPVLLSNKALNPSFDSRSELLVNRIYYAQPKHFSKGIDNYYREVLKSIKPGLNCLLVHVALNDKEMQEITMSQPDYGSVWRQIDYDFFTSNECHQLINNNNIKLITWREIRDKLIRNQ